MNEGSKVIDLSLRVILGAVFIWAGSAKLLDLDSFVESVGYFKISPFDAAPWDMWLGYMLPLFEVLVGAALILGVLFKGAVVSVLLLSIGFLVAVVSAHVRGLNIECGCFGKALSFDNYYYHIAVLVVMSIMAVVLCLREMMRGRSVEGGDQNKLA